MTDDDINSILNGIESKTLQDELLELNAKLAREAQEHEELNSILAQHDKEREQLRQQFNQQLLALDVKNRELKEKRFDKNRDLMKLKMQQESLQRQLEQQEINKKKESQFKNLEVKWDEIFDAAQNAFPHQREGAKRMAYSGQVLLADTMGLGKTYTALLACDLIQSMTNETDPEHPFILED